MKENVFITSNIFDREEEGKENAFSFKKNDLQAKKEIYSDSIIQGLLYKKSAKEENELNEKYFILCDHKIIQFKVSRA